MNITGVGSLPHADPAEAAAFVLATTDLAYLPQLPLRHPEERMLTQWGDGLCGCGANPGPVGLAFGAPPGPRDEAFGGARAVLAALPPGTAAVKTQATGPVTLGLAMLAAGHPVDGLWECLVGGLAARVRDHVDLIAAALPDAAIVLLVDEPALAGLREPGFPLPAGRVDTVLRSFMDHVGGPVGLHCCGSTDWRLVAGLRPAWLSWDVATLGDDFDDALDELAAAVAAGTRLIWGVTPTDVLPVPSAERAAARVTELMEGLVVAGAGYAHLLDTSMLSPACGLAGGGVSQAHAIMDAVRAVARELTADG